MGWKIHATGFRFGRIRPENSFGDRVKDIMFDEVNAEFPRDLKKGTRVEFELNVFPDLGLQLPTQEYVSRVWTLPDPDPQDRFPE